MTRGWTRALPALALGVLFAALYFLTRSPSLDEWDSVQFALGVGDFNLWQHQPHPPGYPLYIAAGWVATHLLPLDVPTALQLVSAIGGGGSVACWYVMVGRRFGDLTAVLTALTLGCLLIVWMTATKVLTDPLGAGLLAGTLLLATGDRQGGAFAGFVGAMAVGARPQNFPVVVLILGMDAWGKGGRRWAINYGTFLAGCLCWLVPVAVIQARAPESAGNPWAYGSQLVHQWRWRFDQPKVFLAAKGQSNSMLQERLGRHFLDWLARGFGFPFKRVWGWAGVLMLAVGWTLHGLQLLRRGEADARAFWRGQWPWAALYVGIVFACLPGDQRYYLPIYPLLALAAVAGWRTLPGRWTWAAGVVPATALAVTIPFIGINHTEEAPPVRIMRYLQGKYPAGERGGVWLVLLDNRRHAEWYAADFHVIRAETVDPAAWPQDWGTARAIYTDDSRLVARPPAGRRWRLVCTFSRSPLIYRKHNEAMIWLLGP